MDQLLQTESDEKEELVSTNDSSSSMNLINSYQSNQKFNILICTDFAFPKFGGVETHGYQLGQCLIERGHKVTFISNKFQGTRCGVRYMANGMKVYHLPHLPVMAGDVAFVTFFSAMPLIRQILIREQIEIVHGHQSTSILQHIVLMAAKSFGLKTVFTEHSLFGYNEFFSIHLNKLIKWSFRDLDAAICVSHACKDNFVLRAKFDPRKTFTVPNAVDSQKFTPDPSIREKELIKSGNPDQINIVFISRLEYRKGVDLLIGIIPKILAQFKNVHFIIGGDGQGMSNLQQLVEKHNLHGRVELLGGLPHEKVRDVLCRGHIFLNTSLTESFCIAILEAACCGLLIVSTDVGGVPEVLPPHMAYLAKPEEKSILRQLCRAVKNVKKIPTEKFYSQVASLYSWRQVAERTEKVYEYAISKPSPDIMVRIKTTLAWGSMAGICGLFYTIIEALMVVIIEIFQPLQNIDVAPIFNQHVYNEDCLSYGSHLFSVNHLLPDPVENISRFKPIILDVYDDEQIKEDLLQNQPALSTRRQNVKNRFIIKKPSAEFLIEKEQIEKRQQETEKQIIQSTKNEQQGNNNSEQDLEKIKNLSQIEEQSSVCPDICYNQYLHYRKTFRTSKKKKSLKKQKISNFIQIEKKIKQACYSCSSRLEPYGFNQDFVFFQRLFNTNLTMPNFYIPGHYCTPIKSNKNLNSNQQGNCEESTARQTDSSEKSKKQNKTTSTPENYDILNGDNFSSNSLQITGWQDQSFLAQLNQVNNLTSELITSEQYVTNEQFVFAEKLQRNICKITNDSDQKQKDLIDIHFENKINQKSVFMRQNDQLNHDSQMQVE